MPRSADKLFVKPLFYDALSGEFSVFNNTRHTLGRLAFATAAKGDLVPITFEAFQSQNGRIYIDARGYSYQPSWAPDLTSTVTTLVDGDSKVEYLQRVTLEGNRRQAWFTDASLSQNIGELAITHWRYPEESHELVLNSVGNVRDRVTQVAQEFISMLPSQTRG